MTLFSSRSVAVVCAALISFAATARLSANDLGLEAPAGFEVSLYADDSLAHDIYSMTVDALGRVVVSGPGYVKILHDDNGDGRADRAQLFSAKPAGGAHGLLFVGNDLICTGDNTVMRLRDADGDGTADGPPEVWAALRNPEHGANGLVHGPDGWIYLICGNDAGVSERQVTTSTSPVEHPQCGAVVRFSPDGKQQEVYAHGFRNPYDLDFNPAGQLFTVDSDGERDYHLPWYAPTRLFDIAAGMQHGWLLTGWQRSWNRPPWLFDAVERTAELGRGSPTGVVCYRHAQFPPQYQGGVFSACWTLGRVYHLPLEPTGATYRSQPEVFLRTTGETGFAPCDLAVGRDGELFVAIGGRRTLGSVFVVRYTGTNENGQPQRGETIDQVLRAPQPLAAWSRATWTPLANKLGREAFVAAAADPGRPEAERVRAVEVLVELFDGLDAEAGSQIVKAKSATVAARVGWALGRGQRQDAELQLLVALTHEDDARVRRAAWESIACWPGEHGAALDSLDWEQALDPADRRVRGAALQAAARTCRQSFDKLSGGHASRPADQLAQLWVEFGRGSVPAADHQLARALSAFEASEDTAVRLEAVRLMQLGLGDMRIQPGQAEVFSGYRAAKMDGISAEQRGQISRAVARVFPSRNPALDYELARLAGMLDVENRPMLAALSGTWSETSSTEDDLHYLIVSALLPGPRTDSITARGAHALLWLERKLRAHDEYPSQNWPFRVAEMFDELCRRDSSLAERLVEQPEFGGPEHVLFAARLSGEMRLRAIRRLLANAAGQGDSLSSELVSLVGELPADESLPFVRQAWNEPGLRDAAALVLARNAEQNDRPRLVEALSSVQPNVVEQCARALGKLDGTATPDELRAALAALRAACQVPEQSATRTCLVELLDHWTRGAVRLDQAKAGDPASVWAAWRDWLSHEHPEQLKQLESSGSVDLAAWQTRLAGIDWNLGDAQRGRRVFESKSCHRCHQAAGQLGPDLTGAVTRMSRDDLFTAILDPNKEVSPAFQTTMVVTSSGRVYQGLVVYDSPESTLLQTGPDTTVRIVGAEKSALRPVRQSLMPTGLLNGLSDQELADLQAYLKTLGKK